MNLTTLVHTYFNTIDDSLDKLSNHHEGILVNLPGWVLQKRTVIIGLTFDRQGIAFKVTPNDNLEEDEFITKFITSRRDINSILAPMNYEGPLPNLGPKNNFVSIGELSIVEANNPLAIPALDFKGMMGWGNISGFITSFSQENAQKKAIEIWNNALAGKKTGNNYIQETKNIFDKIQAIIKRKAFLERRIHRFINDQKVILLPNHKNCYYEHKLFDGSEMRKADFILEREQGMPSLLIELESPVHNVFTKRHDLTAPANHARQQISEWVKFIERDSAQNTKGKFEFLSGPKERLVIIGRGLTQRELLIDTKHDGVTFWTYSMMIEEAKARVNSQLINQYRLLGMEEIRPF